MTLHRCRGVLPPSPCAIDLAIGWTQENPPIAQRASVRRCCGVMMALVVVFFLCALSACGPVEIDKPDPPAHLAALHNVYEHPPGVVDQTTAREAILEYGALALLVDRSQVHVLVEDVLGDSTAEVGDDSSQQENGLRLQRQGLGFGGNGYLQITRVCDGWGDGLAPGQMDLTLTFSPDEESGVAIDPVVWGRFTDCRYRAGGQDGETVLFPVGTGVNLHHGGIFSFDSPGQGWLLLEIAGSMAIGSDVVEEGLDFRVDAQAARYEFRVDTSAGQLIGSGGLASLVELRGSNGTWSCDSTSDGTCTNQETGDTFLLR